MKTILVVDDEPKIVKLVRDYLERAGFGVRVASDGKSALSLARTEKPDLVILDLGLPQMDGLDVTRELRLVSNVPVIMLTGRSDESDKLIGLELGADDYVTKPFSPKELVARVRVLFRRMDNYARASQEFLRAADLTLDLPSMRVSAEGRTIEELTPTEFALLAGMARQPGRVFTRAQLLDAVHGVAFESYERAIDAHIKNIRHKIELNPAEPRYILTVYGVGYKFANR
jgi:two-component system OmpR family response regulator